MQYTSNKYPVPMELATQVITAAWLTYTKLGATDRSHREIVNDPIVQMEHDGKSCPPKQVGDVLVPSLHNTVVENILYIRQPEQSVPRIPLEITDEIREKAQADADIIRQSALFKTLQGDIDSFMQGIGQDLNQTEVIMGDIKRLCYLHTMADQIRVMQQGDQLLANANPLALAPIGHSAKVTVTVLNCRYSKEWNTYNHTVITDDGHLASFFNKQRHEFMARMVIQGNVKDHRKAYKREHLTETRMNYVKIISIISGDTQQ